MKILLTGASGLVGKALKPKLEAAGHIVVALSTSQRPGAYRWRPEIGNIPEGVLQGVDTVIHLAGSPIDAIWTNKRKTLIYNSRIFNTAMLCEQLASLPVKPRRVILASGIHICPYLPQPEAPVSSETYTQGSFLATVIKDWELAARSLHEAKIDALHLRLGVVMSPKGGMLKKILPIAWCRLMPILGNGKQKMSWISLEDVIEIILWSLKTEGLKGPLAAVTPDSITQLEWATTVARHYHYKLWLHLPAGLIRLFLGQMAEELIFSNLSVQPKKLLDEGYAFRFSSFLDYLNFSLA